MSRDRLPGLGAHSTRVHGRRWRPHRRGRARAEFYAAPLEVLEIPPAEAPQWDEERWPELKKALPRSSPRARATSWAALFADVDACTTPVYTMAEAPQQAHMAARGTFVEVDGVLQPAPAPRFSRTPGAMTRSAPDPGRHRAALTRGGSAGGDRGPAQCRRVGRSGVFDKGRGTVLALGCCRRVRSADMLSTMPSLPLTVQMVFEHGRRVYSDRQVTHYSPSGFGRPRSARSAIKPSGSRAVCAGSAYAKAIASPPTCGTTPNTSRCTSRCRAWARCCTPSTSASTSVRPRMSSIMAAPACCSSTRHWPRSSHLLRRPCGTSTRG